MSRIRITGGQWRSRLISVAEVPGLRPTPDRVRETLFNWLGHDLSGLCCLDLFAGSGILGFEAASRGAARVTFVEKDARAFRQLTRNAETLASDSLQLCRDDGVEFLSRAVGAYDLLFLDPPYGQGLLERVTPHLDRALRAGARIYAEAEHPLEGLGSWRVIRQGRAGQVCFHLLEQPEKT